MKSAAKVGLLLIVFVVLFIGSFWILNRNLFVEKHRTIYVQLSDAGGLAEGSKVLMAGVQVGSVQRVSLVSPQEARLKLTILNHVQIPVGTVAVIPNSLVGFGENDLTLVAPTSYTSMLTDGALIKGTKAGPLDSILPDRGKELYANVNQTLKAVQALLKDQGLQKNFKQLLAQADKTLLSSQQSLQRFDRLAARTDSLIASNQGNLTSMVASMKGTIEQIHYTASTLASFVKQGKVQNGTVAILDKATGIENQASELLKNLNKLTGDSHLQHELESTLHNTEATTAKGPAIAQNVQNITSNIAEITDKSKGLPDRLNDVAAKASTLEDKLGSLIDKFNGVKTPNTSGLKDIRTELDLIRETNPGYWRTDLNVMYPLKDGYVTFGLYDALESNKINLQLSHELNKVLSFRYGIYASKPGVGVDFDIARKLSLRTDLWNINSPELDARLRYDFGGGFVGWAGVDRAFSHTTPAIGVGVVR